MGKGKGDGRLAECVSGSLGMGLLRTGITPPFSMLQAAHDRIRCIWTSKASVVSFGEYAFARSLPTYDPPSSMSGRAFLTLVTRYRTGPDAPRPVSGGELRRRSERPHFAEMDRITCIASTYYTCLGAISKHAKPSQHRILIDRLLSVVCQEKLTCCIN